MCGNDHLIFDGDQRPGISFQLTSSSKYKPNFSCTVRFRTAQPSQRLIITIEKMDIVDCSGDLLRIYDGTTLINNDPKQQCGSPASFTFTVGFLIRSKNVGKLCDHLEFNNTNIDDIYK